MTWSLKAQRSNLPSFSSLSIRLGISFLKQLKPNLETAETWADCFAARAMTALFGWVWWVIFDEEAVKIAYFLGFWAFILRGPFLTFHLLL